MAHSSRAGGCTFAEDPGESCASILPMWSAAVDARVLAARAVAPVHDDQRRFDGRAPDTCRVQGPSTEHLLVDRGGEPLRIDVVEGTTAEAPAALHFDLTVDGRLELRIAALRAFVAPAQRPCRHGQLARRLLCLQAVDLHALGASLKETAERMLGPGDWPGDGEHRKSRVRRMILAGERMVAAGPGPILAG